MTKSQQLQQLLLTFFSAFFSILLAGFYLLNGFVSFNISVYMVCTSRVKNGSKFLHVHTVCSHMQPYVAQNCI